MNALTKLPRPLLLLALTYLLIGTLFAFLTPDWQAPDEPAHYNYVAQVAVNGCCPIIQAGDWNQAYLTRLTSTRFSPSLLGSLATVQYEDHQPPLYYTLGAMIFRFTNSSLIALRLFSVVLGLGVVLCAYGIAALLLPGRPWIALGTAALVAFLPQHVHILASVSNDSMAELVVALALLLCVVYLKRIGTAADQAHNRERWVTLVWGSGILGALLLVGGGETIVMGMMLIALAGAGVWLVLYDVRGDAWLLWLMGMVVGVGLITKASTYLLAGVVPLAVLLRWWLDRPETKPVAKVAGGVVKAAARAKPVQNAARRALKTETGRRFGMWLVRRWLGGLSLGDLLRRMLLVLLPALLLGGIWWARNITVYGFPDFLGLAAHDAVVVGQPRTADLIAQVGFEGYLEQFLTTTFNSFFGQFGWMALPVLPAFWWLQLAWVGLLLAALLGLLISRSRAFRRGEAPDAQDAAKPEGQRAAWTLLLVTLLLAVLAYLYYNTEFQQFQGRYLYVGLIPFALLIVLGLDVWRRLFSVIGSRSTQDGLRQYAIVLPLLLFAPLDLWLLWTVLVPNLTAVQ